MALGLFEWVFDDEPAADVEEQNRYRGERDEYDNAENPGSAGSRADAAVRIIEVTGGANGASGSTEKPDGSVRDEKWSIER